MLSNLIITNIDIYEHSTGKNMVFQLLIMLLPWKLRRALLSWRYGWSIDKSARIGKSLIFAKCVVMGANSRIHDMVFCRRIDRLVMGCDSGIASLTFITGISSAGTKMYGHVKDRRCELVLGRSAGITSRHYVDCNGGVYVGDFSTVAGIRTQILTHSIDIYGNRQDAKPIKIGKYCFIGTGCILLPGSQLPDYSVLGAGSVLTKFLDQPGVLYAGAPARAVKKFNVAEVPYFHREKHFVD